MDKISSGIQPVISNIHIEKKAEVKPAAEGVNTAPPADTAELSAPGDSVKLTRQDRIQIDMDKGMLNLTEYVEVGSALFTGQIVGAAVAMAAVGGTIPLAVGAVAGGLAGAIAHYTDLDRKIGPAFQKTMGLAMLPFYLAAKAVKKGVSLAIDAVKPSKTKEADAGNSGKASASGEKKEAKGTGSISDPHSDGGILAEETAVKEASGKEDEKIRKSIVSTITSGLGTAAKALRSIPKFLYPSIKNATPQEAKVIMDTLDSLPMKDVVSTSTITVNPNLAKELHASGLARPLMFDNPLELDRGEFSNPAFGKEVLIHELGHARDFSEVPIPGVGKSFFKPWGKEPYVFDPMIDVQGEPPYAATNHFEDFAQSHQFYHTKPEQLKAVSAEKFADMEKLHEPGLYDKLIDRSGVREAGKKLSEAIDQVPYLRQTLNVAGTVMGPVAMNVGANAYEDGLKEADKLKKYEGKMELAQGISLSAKVTAPYALGLSVAKMVINHKLKKGNWSVEKADEFASKALAAAGGPVGMIYLAATSEMLKSGTKEAPRDFAYTERKPETLKEKILRNVESYDVHLADTKQPIKEEDTKLTTDDKIFIAKTGGGALALGIAGTMAGWTYGGAAGAAIGGLAGGPIGALVGGLIGSVAGTMTLSYQGAKLGAKIGKALHSPEKQEAPAPQQQQVPEESTKEPAKE
ncbi:MAG: hypothetical protein LWY06_19545 [Firmicutes bacterium]|nr:hypothetical protein [Bacillota bacterium]